MVHEVRRKALPAALEPGLGLLRPRGPELHESKAHRLASSLCRSLRRMISSQAGEGVDDGRQGPAGRDFGQVAEKLGHGGSCRKLCLGVVFLSCQMLQTCKAPLSKDSSSPQTLQKNTVGTDILHIQDWPRKPKTFSSLGATAAPEIPSHAGRAGCGAGGQNPSRPRSQHGNARAQGRSRLRM